MFNKADFFHFFGLQGVATLIVKFARNFSACWVVILSLNSKLQFVKCSDDVIATFRESSCARTINGLDFTRLCQKNPQFLGCFSDFHGKGY